VRVGRLLVTYVRINHMKKERISNEDMTLTDALFALFNIDSSYRNDHILQLDDSEFDDWLDIEDDTVLPPSGKLV